MRLYRSLYFLPKFLNSSVAIKQEQFHSAARQLIRLEPFRCTLTTDTPPMTKVQAVEVVQKLTSTEREALRQALNQYEVDRFESKLEPGELPANRWAARISSGRSKRKQYNSGNDAAQQIIAGTIKSEEGTNEKLADAPTEPTRDDLLKLMIVNSVPFIGFGFLDNFCMIIAGDYIEHTLGVYMCISTMAAAGLGNTISDVLGLGLAHYVEQFCIFLGLRPPKLTPEQMASKAYRRVSSYGRALGITIGCLLGMCPLYFMQKSPKAKEPTETPTKSD